MRVNPRAIAAVALTLLVAMALRVLPLPMPWFEWNPDWMALVLIYWILALPDRVGVGTAWLAGLFADVLTGRLLGQHALAYAVVAYLTQRWYQRLRLYPLVQQTLGIMVFLLLSQLLVFWTQSARSETGIDWRPALSGALAWPPIMAMLRWIRRTYKVA